jgi:hypothetical protein
MMNKNLFTLQSLTASILALPFQPTRIAQLGWFGESGINTLDVAIEEKAGQLSLLEVKPRGGPGVQMTANKRTVRTFRVPHIPESATIMADEVQGVRAFGSDNQAEVVQTRINERLAYMKASMDYTMEVHRVAAIKGNYYDVNGNLTSLFTAFDVAQQTKAVGLHATNSSAIRDKMFDVRKKIKAALGGTPYTGLRVLCGDDFWSALLEDKDTKATYLNQQQAAELRGNPTDSFSAFGATWEWYSGTTDATLGSDAYAVPEGVPGLFITRFGPADYMETVNTIGLPYYAKGEPLKMNKGWEIEAQSNPLNLCTRPRAVIKLTI